MIVPLLSLRMVSRKCLLPAEIWGNLYLGWKPTNHEMIITIPNLSGRGKRTFKLTADLKITSTKRFICISGRCNKNGELITVIMEPKDMAEINKISMLKLSKE